MKTKLIIYFLDAWKRCMWWMKWNVKFVFFSRMHEMTFFSLFWHQMHEDGILRCMILCLMSEMQKWFAYVERDACDTWNEMSFWNAWMHVRLFIRLNFEMLEGILCLMHEMQKWLIFFSQKDTYIWWIMQYLFFKCMKWEFFFSNAWNDPLFNVCDAKMIYFCSKKCIRWMKCYICFF